MSSRPYSHSNPRRRTPIIDRIAARVALTDAGCLEWTGSLNAYGYGQIRVGARADGTDSATVVHRVLYELVVGPVAADLDLDHLCRNRACCRPDHLEPVSRRENIRRGIAARRLERVAP